MEQQDWDELWNAKIDHLEIEESHFQSGFVQIRNYAEVVEQSIVEHVEKVQRNTPTPNKEMTEEEKDYFFEEIFGEIYEIERDFPRILRYSLFVYTYSDVVFWRVPSELTSRHDPLLLGKQRATEICRSLPELESCVRLHEQRLHACLGVLTTRFPHGFEGEAPFGR